LSALVHERTIFCAHYNPTACRYDGPTGSLGCLSQYATFTRAKVVFAVVLEDRRDTFAALFFDKDIRIKKWLVQSLCEYAAYIAFSTARKAGEEDTSHVIYTPLGTFGLFIIQYHTEQFLRKSLF